MVFICDQEKTTALPANHENVSSYIKNLSNGKLKSASIRIAYASISAIHRLNDLPNPTNHASVKLELRRMHRTLGRESKQALGINAELLKEMLNAADKSLRGRRDEALLLTAYDSMCRRSELVSLMVNDLIIEPENRSVKIKLRRSKTDPDGLGRWLHLGMDSQSAILEWIESSGITDGMLFRGVSRGDKIAERLSAAQISLYKRIARKSKVDQSLVKHISGHSMRVGAARGLLKSGASLPMMMQRGRWSKADTVMRYLENTTCIFTANNRSQSEWSTI